MKKYIYKAIWKLHRLTSKGYLVIIKPTMKCNLKCPYCSNVIATGKRPVYKPEHTPEEWVEFLNRFPIPIQVVSISGGEPQVYPQINELIALLLKNGYWVRVMTNLSLDKIIVTPSYRLTFTATYHGHVPYDEWSANYDSFISKGYNMLLNKKFSKKYIRGKSQQFDLIDEQYSDLIGNKIHRWKRNIHNKFVITPDLRVWTSCLETNHKKTLTQIGEYE